MDRTIDLVHEREEEDWTSLHGTVVMLEGPSRRLSILGRGVVSLH